MFRSPPPFDPQMHGTRGACSTRMTEGTTEAGTAHLKNFEDLVSKFQITSQSLERSYRGLQSRVRELSAELEVEKEQRIRLERLAAMGEMAMELAHEIRNPLGSIELYASMLDGDYADQIVRGVRLLNHSVTNILQFGQPIYPRVEELSVSELVEGVRSFVAPLAREKAVHIEVLTESGSTGLGDRELLHRALLNLVLNALREVPTGGSIQLKGRTEDGVICLVVEDNGPGIPPEVLPGIFDPIHSTARNGSGMGLSIVKRIVESHDGTIRVQSSEAGTRFEMKLGSAQSSPHGRRGSQAFGHPVYQFVSGRSRSAVRAGGFE